MIKKFFKVIYYVLIAGIVAVALMLVISIFPITGNYQIKIVLSGSMEPAIKVGSVAIIKPVSNYKIGDIITFGKDDKENVPTTHRIAETHVVAGEMFFVTKGDANNNTDSSEIRERDIVGKVLFSIPFLGYMIDFAKKPIGFFLLIGIPAIAIVADELRKVWKEIKKIRNKKTLNNNEEDNNKN